MDRSGSHNLTREGLDRFLARLDPDRQRAGEQYQKLHRKLVKLFEWRGAPCAESLADETIDRVIRRMDEVDIRDVSLYVLGVAQNVLRESHRATTKSTSLDELPAGAQLMNSNELAGRFECLDECMNASADKGTESRHRVLRKEEIRKYTTQAGDG